jgi:hypothetical protein
MNNVIFTVHIDSLGIKQFYLVFNELRLFHANLSKPYTFPKKCPIIAPNIFGIGYICQDLSQSSGAERYERNA